jgi:hypothetical protein
MLWACGSTVYHGRSMQWKRPVYLIMAGKQKEKKNDKKGPDPVRGVSR